MSKNSNATHQMLRYSPEPYQLSPASVLNQQNRGLIRSNSDYQSSNDGYLTAPNSPINLKIEVILLQIQLDLALTQD